MFQYLNRVFSRARADQSGATGTEYALIAGGLAIAIVASVQFTAVEAKKPFENVATGISSATP